MAKEKQPKKWWEFPFKVSNPSRGGLNMPKSQPCPECQVRSKRETKSATGAWYNCKQHGRFFVQYGREVLALGYPQKL